MARRRRTGTIWQRSDCFAASFRVSAVNFGRVSEIKEAIFDSLRAPAPGGFRWQWCRVLSKSAAVGGLGEA